MVRLDDVAKFAGVSKNTASRVLNNQGLYFCGNKAKSNACYKRIKLSPK